MRFIRLFEKEDYDWACARKAFATAYAEVPDMDGEAVRRVMQEQHDEVITVVSDEGDALLIMRAPIPGLGNGVAAAVSFYAKGWLMPKLVELALDCMDAMGATSVQAVEHSTRIDAYLRLMGRIASVKPAGVIYEFRRK